MCDCYKRCKCLRPQNIIKKPLSLLLLDCWQREYDERPYRNFIFDRLQFEDRMGRPFHEILDWNVIVQFLQRRSLCSIQLRGFRIVAYPMELLESFVITLTQITRITLKLMHLPNKFFHLLSENVDKMKVKELSFEGSELRRPIIPCVQEFLYKCQTLVSLNVNHCSILQYDFALIADGVYKSPKVANLHCNRLLGGTLTLESEKMMNLFAQLIWQNRLTELEIQHNEFTARDMEVLAEYLRSRLCRLRKLNVAYNIIGPDGAKYLLRAISFSSSLTHLNMCGNELGTNGGEHVSNYLSACACLEYLNITYNNIGVAGINRLLTSLKKSIMLQRLEVWGNHFDSYTAMVLRRLLQARVVPQSTIDITATADETGDKYRIIPYIEWKPSDEWEAIAKMKRRVRALEKEEQIRKTCTLETK